MDWSEKTLCIKCNEGGNLLVCSETSCPLAIHEGCMSCPARFDDEGHFYCPYCLYKQAVAESPLAREYALARKKALLTFMDEDMIGQEKQSDLNKGAEANVHNQSNVSEEEIGSEEEKIQEEEIEASAGSKGQDPSLQMPQEQKTSNEEDFCQEPSLKMHECETSSASSGQDSLPLRERAKRAFKRRKSMRRNSEAVSVKSKLVEQSDKNKQTSPTVNSPRRSSRRSSSALRTEEVIKEKVEASKRLKQPELPPVKLANDTFGTGKRKRLLWREEEEILKAGVQKYSMEPNKNIPWRDILDLGRNVFDRTRTPSDLKDKWRNMARK